MYPYRRLAGQLRDAIRAGIYPPGSRIPSLTQLGEDTGFAVETIRRAMSVLEGEGLVQRVQGRGTFVVSRDTK